jgi:hypothetical protein
LFGYKHTTNDDLVVDHDNFIVVSGTVHADHTRKKIAIFSGGDQHTGDKCFTEIEHWDAVNETATLHVQVPTLTSGTDTDLYLYEDINQPDQDYRLISEANDVFTAASGSTPDHTKWKITFDDPEIRDNKLFVTSSGGGQDCGIMSRFALEGNFDIQIDWELDVAPSTQNWALPFEVREDDLTKLSDWNDTPGGKVVSVSRRYDASGHGYNFYTYNGGWVSRGSAYSLNHTSGKLRMVRVDDTFECFYYLSGWTSLGTYTFTGIANSLTVAMGLVSWTGNPTPQGHIDNFTVTSGTVTGFVGDTGEKPAMEVWDGDFVFVHHCNATDPSTASNCLDSTAGDAADTSNLEADDAITGQVGRAYDLDQEWLLWPDADKYTPTDGELSVECLFTTDSISTSENRGLITKFIGFGSDDREWALVIDTTGHLRSAMSDDGTGAGNVKNMTDSVQLLTGTYYYGALLWDGGNTDSWLRKNDSQVASDSSAHSTLSNQTAKLAIGNNYRRTSDFALNGIVCEARVSKVLRSTAWCDTTYYGLSDELVFYDLLPPTPPEPPEPPTPSGLNDAEGCATVNDVLTSGIVVRLYKRSDGSLVGEDTTNASGTWNIPTTYDEYHYAIGLYPVSGTNALIYDWLYPTTVS